MAPNAQPVLLIGVTWRGVRNKNPSLVGAQGVFPGLIEADEVSITQEYRPLKEDRLDYPSRTRLYIFRYIDERLT